MHFIVLRGVTVVVGEGNGTPLQYSYLENPMDGGAWWAAVHGVTKSRTRLSDFTFTFSLSCIGEGNGNPLQFSAWRIPGTGEPGGLTSVGSLRVGHDWVTELNWTLKLLHISNKDSINYFHVCCAPTLVRMLCTLCLILHNPSREKVFPGKKTETYRCQATHSRSLGWYIQIKHLISSLVISKFMLRMSILFWSCVSCS